MQRKYAQSASLTKTAVQLRFSIQEKDQLNVNSNQARSRFSCDQN